MSAWARRWGFEPTSWASVRCGSTCRRTRRAQSHLTVVITLPVLHPQQWGAWGPSLPELARHLESAAVYRLTDLLDDQHLRWTVRVVHPSAGELRRVVDEAGARIVVLPFRNGTWSGRADRRRAARLSRMIGVDVVLVDEPAAR
jgi:hypothetical protein